MMNNDETFPFIIHNTGNHGVSFQSIVYKEGKFVGLTSNYALFETADGTVKAVSIKEKEEKRRAQPGLCTADRSIVPCRFWIADDLFNQFL